MVWYIKMRSFLCCGDLWKFVENGYDEPYDEAKDASSLYLIQQSMDGKLFLVVAVPTIT